MATSPPAAADPIDDLPRIRASEVKQQGWRGVMRTLAAENAVLVTNHGRAEAVILQPEAYAGLLEKVERAESRLEADLEALRRRFDERLTSLTAAKAGERLRSVMRGRTKLGGKVKAGTSY